MSDEIVRIIKELEEEIDDRRKEILLLKNLDINNIHTVEEWNKLCNTKLRDTEILLDVLKNIFPEAYDFTIMSNEIRFFLYGILCSISLNSMIKGISIDLSCFYIREKPQKRKYGLVPIYEAYYKKLESKANWYELATLRIGYLTPKELKTDVIDWRRIRFYQDYKKPFLFFLWYFKYKWKQPDKKFFLYEKQIIEDLYQKQLMEYNHYLNRTVATQKILTKKVIPVLTRFTNCFHDIYQGGTYSTEELLEHLKKDD